MKRLFFAVDVSASDKQAIANWRDKQLALPFKAIVADNFHITLAFLGRTTTDQQQQLMIVANELAQHISGINEQTLQLRHTGLFKKPQVLYLGLATCPSWLTTLAQNLSKAAIAQGLSQENRRYCPHLSIYRKATSINQTIAIDLSIQITSFSLYQSKPSDHGVIYQPIKTYSLIK